MAGVEPVHRSDEADRAGLLDVLAGFAATAEAPGDVPYDGEVAGDQLGTQPVPVRMTVRERDERGQHRSEPRVVVAE